MCLSLKLFFSNVENLRRLQDGLLVAACLVAAVLLGCLWLSYDLPPTTPSSTSTAVWLCSSPGLLAAVTALSVLLGTQLIVQAWYHGVVQQRHEKLKDRTEQAQSLVSSIFPSLVRDRLYAHEESAICEVFQETTVLFVDIVGFCAWSSEREPIAIFLLLETLFGKFDEHAKEMGVFKVETVGDCYLAVTGLPTPRPDHAVVMAEFANKCRREFVQVCASLEVTLGPGTSDLQLRLGVHSGAVVGGVLRGDRARFQLFGDTVNVASRMESNGMPNQIHVSSATAELIKESGHSNWITPRKELVFAKGKGCLQTYWCHPTDNESIVTFIPASLSEPCSSPTLSSTDEQTHIMGNSASSASTVWGNTSVGGAAVLSEGLIDWNAELLIDLLRKVVSKRKATTTTTAKLLAVPTNKKQTEKFKKETNRYKGKNSVMDQIAEVIPFAKFDAEAELAYDRKLDGSESEVLSDDVKAQVREFVADVAAGYNDVPFHNFEHASHVMLSVIKLLNRIKKPRSIKRRDTCDSEDGSTDGTTETKQRVLLKEAVHEQTFGISSDPVLHFAVAMAALIHDMGHEGVSNKQLVRRQTPEAIKYEGRCVAEQHSLLLSREVIMAPKFAAMRTALFGNSAETVQRYRQFLVNTVLATDIADKELRQMRQVRWTKAFETKESSLLLSEEELKEASDRKATIVLDHLIQASDIAHTMQHWQVFTRWNKRLFREMYRTYMSEQSDEDPRPGWYKGEIGFFDFYVIPLATKLWECGVFGVCGDEYLNYAKENRRLWEERGEKLVEEMLEECEREFPSQPQSPV